MSSAATPQNNRRVIRLLIASIVVQFVVVGLLLDQNADTAAQVRTTRESQYVACIQSGNGLRQDVRDEFIDLKREVLIPVFSRVAATIPPGAESRDILGDAVDYMRQRIKTIELRIPDVDCLERYPPLEGQVYPEVSPNGNTPSLP